MGPPVMTFWVVQLRNVAGEEARQVLNEMDFNVLNNDLFTGNSKHFWHFQCWIPVCKQLSVQNNSFLLEKNNKFWINFIKCRSWWLLFCPHNFCSGNCRVWYFYCIIRTLFWLFSIVISQNLGQHYIPETFLVFRLGNQLNTYCIPKWNYREKK